MINKLPSYFYITTGALLMALALNIFLEPNGIVTGGVTGLGIIAEHISRKYLGFTVPMWLTNLVVNVPLLFFAYKVSGTALLKKTFFGTLILSFFLGITTVFPSIKSDYFLATIFGGTISGLGIGLIFRGNGTTGGSDLLSTLINLKFPSLKVSQVLFIIDVVIIVMGYFVFGEQPTMYAVIGVFVVSKVIDMVLGGLNYAKVAFIFSENPDEIGKELMSTLNRGATLLYGKGMYTGSSRNLIMVVAASKQISALKATVYSLDARAFIFIADVREVLGDF